MKRVASMGVELNLEERSLLSAAFKNAVSARRQAWRAVNQLEKAEKSKGPAALALINHYRTHLEDELRTRCGDMINILTKDLVPKAISSNDIEAKVFYKKLKGDYHRYLAEFADGEQHNKCAQEAHDAYQEASEDAAIGLEKTHPIRLGLALNFSVFYYEVFSSPEKACLLAKAAFDDAMKEMDNLREEDSKDTYQMMQLLRDNLTLWTSSVQIADDSKPPEVDVLIEDFPH